MELSPITSYLCRTTKRFFFFGWSRAGISRILVNSRKLRSVIRELSRVAMVETSQMLTDRHHPDLPLEQSLARSLPQNYSPRIMEATPTPLSRSVIRASSRASPLREAWRQAQASRPQSSEEIEVLSQLGDAIKRLRTHDNNVGLAASVPLGTTRRTTASVDLGREMDLLESMGKIEQISRVPRSGALLVLMAEVLVLTLEHASSRAAAQRRGSPPPPSPSPSPQPSALSPQPSALSPQPSAPSPQGRLVKNPAPGADF